MSDPRILTIQDISCVGQCSLTVALPILSACGVETAILPSAVLSTHTAGFTGYTFRDLTEDMPKIAAHWQKEGIAFDAFYTGYLGSAQQIQYVEDIFHTLGRGRGLKIVDPAMADNGSYYTGFGHDMRDTFRRLCAHSHVITPNITEAALLAGEEYRPAPHSREYLEHIFEGLAALEGLDGCEGFTLLRLDADNDGAAVETIA